MPIAQIKLYKIRSACKNQGEPPYAITSYVVQKSTFIWEGRISDGQW